MSAARALLARSLASLTRAHHHRHRAFARAPPARARRPLTPPSASAFRRVASSRGGVDRREGPRSRRAIETRASSGETTTTPYDADALLNKTGFLVTVQPGKGARPIHATTRAVEEAKYVLTRAIRPVTAVDRVVAAADALGDSLPLHERGESGCTFLEMKVFDDELKHFNPCVPYAIEAIDEFIGEPLPPIDSPEYLARLVPIERTCAATETAVVGAVKTLLPQHFRRPTQTPATYYDSHREPTKFYVHYEHHGKSEIDRKALVDAIAELLPSPDYVVDAEARLFFFVWFSFGFIFWSLARSRAPSSSHRLPAARRVAEPYASYAERTISVIVYHAVALVSVLPRYNELRQYNLRELVGAFHRAAYGGDAATAAVETTSGGGYP